MNQIRSYLIKGPVVKGEMGEMVYRSAQRRRKYCVVAGEVIEVGINEGAWCSFGAGQTRGRRCRRKEKSDEHDDGERTDERDGDDGRGDVDGGDADDEHVGDDDDAALHDEDGEV
jgi:hypothetical protein